MFLTHLYQYISDALTQVVRASRPGMCRENVTGLSPGLLTTYFSAFNPELLRSHSLTMSIKFSAQASAYGEGHKGTTG